MKDYFGEELKINDKVLTGRGAGSHSWKFIEGTIIGFTERLVHIMTDGRRQIHRQPGHVVRIFPPRETV